ncbi:unnamed protein product, partial [Meganyctiphanes norvegica]
MAFDVELYWLVVLIDHENRCPMVFSNVLAEQPLTPIFMVLSKYTAVPEIEECYKKFMKRDDIDIILINQNIAEQIRHVIDADNDSPLPAVLEIPSKDHPYDPAKDSVLRRAK